MIQLDFSKINGLVPVIAQDFETKEVLMLAFMNELAFQKTLETNIATYFSRSRNKIWVKGETSGHIQKVKEIRIDCDNDSVLLIVEQIGKAACHDGYVSCFYKKVCEDNLEIIGKQEFNPKDVYK